MACFLVPAAEAVVATAVTKIADSKKKETKNEKMHSDIGADAHEGEKPSRPLFVRQLRWLTGMLWGGAILLCFEHLWHGEVVPWFPFLTAASNPADKAEMLHEMSTAGVSMAVLVTAVWIVMVIITTIISKRSSAPAKEMK